MATTLHVAVHRRVCRSSSCTSFAGHS